MQLRHSYRIYPAPDQRQALARAFGCARVVSNKIGDVEVRWSRDLPSDPSSVTVILDAAGRYFASFVVEADDGTSSAWGAGRR